MTLSSYHSSPKAILTRAAVAALVMAGGASAIDAQVAVHQFSITTRAGGIHFDRAASLKTAALLGLDAEYSLTRNFGIGTSINVSRPNTRAEDFLSVLTFGLGATGDTTLFVQTGQSVSLIEGSIVGVGRFPAGRFTPFVLGGGGLYGMFLDPEINAGSRRMSGISGTVGGGLAVRLSDRAGIQFDARDLVFTKYRASRLDPTGQRSPNTIFIEDFPAAPSRKETVHNFMFSLGFRYLPGGAPQGGGRGEGSGT
ncbi:MAG: outer membrane beta-barrel protein [Gemmatimonadaceae bacterium]